MNELMNAVKELKGGSAAAFQLVYEQTRTVALAVIRKYCDNPSDHEDILQETYLKVYKYIGQLDDDEKIQPWINRIAANTAVRYNMKKKPMMFSELADEEGNIPDFEDESGRFSPEIITGRQALSQIVDEILSTLPEDQRTALWMVYGQKITIREMAENLGISENTIKSRLFQGRKKLMERKGDFRKLGVELTIIPISAIISCAFEDTVYAAAAEAALAGAGAAAGYGAYKAGQGIGAGAAGQSAAGAGNTGMASASAGNAGAAVSSAGNAGAAASAGAGGAGMAASGAAGTGAAAAASGAAAAGVSIGVKAAAVVVGAAVITGGGFMAGHAVSAWQNGVETEEAYEEEAETPAAAKEETAAETEAADPYDNEVNRQAVASYRDALEHNSIFFPSSGYGEETLFSVVDVNMDGVYEVYAYVPGQSSAETSAYFLYYADGLAWQPVTWGYFGAIPEDGTFVCTRAQMGINVEIYSWDGKSLGLTDSYNYISSEGYYTEPGRDPETERRLEEKTELLLEDAFVPESLPVNEENLDEYLSGIGKASKEDSWYASADAQGYEEDGSGSGSSEDVEVQEESGLSENGSSDETEAETAAAAGTFSLNDEIQFIRDTYSYTNSHLSEYRKEKGYESISVSSDTLEECDTYYDAQGNLVKMVIPASASSSGIAMEVYHLNPALGRTAEWDYLDYTAVFIYSWDSAGNEYRIYLKEGNVIRYIGPDGAVRDYPDGINLMDFNSDITDGPIWQILCDAMPGWWMAYESSGEW